MTKISSEIPEDLPQDKGLSTPTKGKSVSGREFSTSIEADIKKTTEKVEKTTEKISQSQNVQQTSKELKTKKSLHTPSHQHLQSFGMSQQESKKIIEWITQNSENLSQEQTKAHPHTHQITCPKGLKYYTAKDGTRHIVLTKKTLATGGYKRVQSIYDLSLTTFSVLQLVRYTVKDKTNRIPFEKDIEQELFIREELKKQNNGVLPREISDIQKIAYTGKTGETKFHYISKECDGKVENLIYTEVGDFNPYYNPDQLLSIYIDALKGLEFMHEHGVAHRDIKPGNILFTDQNGTLCDFGLSVKLDPSQKDISFKLSGTPGYFAPEILDHHPPSPSADMFSFGVMLLEGIDNDAQYSLAEAQFNFLTDQTDDKLQEHSDRLEEIRQNLDQTNEFQKLIFDLLDPDPTLRPHAETVRNKLISILNTL